MKIAIKAKRAKPCQKKKAAKIIKTNGIKVAKKIKPKKINIKVI